MSKDLINIKYSELSDLRKKQWEKQGNKCAILDQKIDFKNSCMDHKHSLSSEIVGVNGAGLCRGVILLSVNAVEGKILKVFKRYGVSKLITLPDFLRKLANYIENPPMKDQNYVHPTERVFSIIKKREFNKLSKYYKKKYPKRKELIYPPKGKITKSIQKIIKEKNEENNS